MVDTGGVRGFLFADLRGYTRYVEAHGDGAAADLLADYRGLVRGVIARHDGAEIRTEGDGVYVVFSSVTAAVDAGLELVTAGAAATAATPARPMRVAVGIHAGETTASNDGPVGSAVNIAARVCAKAEAGEILVTETVRSLVRTSRPYRAVALGPQRLKGVAEAVALYRFESAPSRRLARIGRQVRARRARLVAVGLAVALLTAVAAGAWAINRPHDCLTLGRDTTRDVVARIDPVRACVTALIPVGHRPGPVVATDDAVWVANRDDWTVMRIDQATGVVTKTIGVPGSPVAMAPRPPRGVGVLLLNDRERGLAGVGPIVAKLAMIDGDQLRMTSVAPLPRDAGYVALTTFNGRAWVTNQILGDVILDPGLDAIRIDVPIYVGVPGGPDSGSSGVGPIDVGLGAVWIANLHRPRAYSIEGPSGRPSSVSLQGDAGSTSIDATTAAIWLGRADGRLTRLVPITNQQSAFETGGAVAAIAAGPDAVWIVDDDAHFVRRLDPATGAIVSIPAGSRPVAIAIGADGAVYVTISAP